MEAVIFACLVFLFPAFLLFFFFASRASHTGSYHRYYNGYFNFIYISSFCAEGVGEELEWDLSKCHCSVSLKVICYSRSLSGGQIEIERATI